MLWTRYIREIYSLEIKEEKYGGETMQKQEREISIKEILWKIAFGWRSLLVSTLVIAVLVMAFFYLKDMKYYNEKVKEQQSGAEITESGSDFTEEELEEIQSAELLQKLIDERLTYINNSIKMQVNAYEENVLVLTWYVKSDYQLNYAEDVSKDYTEAVVAAYKEYVQGGTLAQKLSEEIEYDSKYVKEILEIKNISESTVFSIEVIYPNQEVLQEMAEIIKNEMAQKTIYISQDIGSHSLKFLSENVMVRTDAELAGYQQNVCNELVSYQSQLSELKDSMTSEQLELLESAKGAEESVENDTNQKSELKKPEIQAKNIVFGFVLGLFLGIVWIICKMLFSARLQNSGELEEIYNVRLLGVIQQPKRVTSVDKLLLKLKNRNTKQMSMETTLDMIVSNIALICQKEKNTRIYLTGSQIEKMDKEILEKIISRLKAFGIEVIYGESICYMAESLRKMVEVGMVVILEQTDLSIYQEIEKEIKVITEQRVKILGGIGINTML